MFIKLITLLVVSFSALAESNLTQSRLQRLSGEKSKAFDRKAEWDSKYNSRVYIYGKSPAKFLAENYDFLKANSTVLDMGMGEGRNAVFLAKKGHKVTGVDISSVAIQKARKLAKEHGVKIRGVVATLKKYKMPENSFDAIICYYYVDRTLNEKIRKWLKPGGVLIYEAHTMKHYDSLKVKKDEKPEYYLKEQELLGMFPEMRVLKYEEPLHEKEYRASIILQKK